MNSRIDRTIRVLMWTDAFLSVAFVGLCLVAAPVLAVLGMSGGVLVGVLVTSLICALLLGVLGPVWATLLMVRMHRGHVLLPRGLRLPLPGGMRPALETE